MFMLLAALVLTSFNSTVSTAQPCMSLALYNMPCSPHCLPRVKSSLWFSFDPCTQDTVAYTKGHPRGKLHACDCNIAVISNDCHKHKLYSRTIANRHNRMLLPIITTLIAHEHAQHLHLCAPHVYRCSSTSSGSASYVCRLTGGQQQAIFPVTGQQYSSALLPWPMCW